MNKSFIANRLVELRGSKTQEEVSLSIGISRTALSMYENGERVPRDEIKMKIAQYYDKSVQSIFFT